ncbi:MAG: cofC [Microbacteriaceae bacterium]|nr:cofC [Microbacteriaceae bacterium]
MVKASFGGEYRDPASRPPTTTGIRKTGKPASESHVPAPTSDWVVVVPVKGTAGAKSRLGSGDNSALAIAIALDTVAAALATPGVSGVLVVTSEAASVVFDETEALVLIEDEPAGLSSAVELGVETASEMAAPGRGIAVLLGDLPALTPAELGAALEQARLHELAMVPDAEGTGTTLITAADGAAHNPAFGPGSAQLHRAAGYFLLDLPAESGLRMDADTRETLDALAGRLGSHSADLR